MTFALAMMLANAESMSGWMCFLIFLILGVIGYAMNKQKEQRAAQAAQQHYYAPQRPSFTRQVPLKA